MDHIKPGNIGDIKRALHAAPCELYFLGASVSTQRNGWPDVLARDLSSATGHAHTVRKTCIGGVGLLYGLSHLAMQPPEDGRRRVAFIEFSTGDLNFGLTPMEHLRPWLREMVARLQAAGALPLVIHNWRADYDVVDKHGIRAAYDEIAAEAGLPVIENHRWIHDLIAGGHLTASEWFRDYCHTTDAGAVAYADQIMRSIASASGEPGDAGRPLPWDPAAAMVRAHPVVDWLPADTAWPVSEFKYTPTDQRFSTVTLAQEDVFTACVSGQLLGVAVISGPRSTWMSVSANGKRLRKLRVFDRNSHYDRYLLCACPAELDRATLEITCDPEPLDVSISAQPHADFSLPRQLRLVELIGRNLVRH